MAGWSEELTDQLLPRRSFEQAILLSSKADGSVAALADIRRQRVSRMRVFDIGDGTSSVVRSTNEVAQLPWLSGRLLRPDELSSKDKFRLPETSLHRTDSTFQKHIINRSQPATVTHWASPISTKHQHFANRAFISLTSFSASNWLTLFVLARPVQIASASRNSAHPFAGFPVSRYISPEGRNAAGSARNT
jgi:hypothetical protein